MENKATGLLGKERILLSTLWIFVTLNYLYCDVMGLMDPNLLKKFLTGNVDGLIINEPFLLAAAVLMEIPIAMVLLSRILKDKINRWANIIAAFIKTAVMILTLFIGTTTIYYLFYAVIEIATTSFIMWYAWRWKTATTA
ncbi:MAG TPA: DUF6326 family protein [Saprospiraceae bacterium]|nr:DUF6326 family protein [Saprospiraceae bacterium]HMQ84412.1 DUF6326 family protein [Saprospiraceae bacterium]